MNERQRLYSTVKEDRELECLKQQFGLDESATTKSGGTPAKAPDQESGARRRRQILTKLRP